MRNFLSRFTKKTFIIAEIGGNHNGDIKRALKMIEEAKSCGADAVKFQTYNAEELVHPDEEPLPLATRFYRSQLERYKSLEFTHDEYRQLAKKAKEVNIIFMSTPFDKGSVDIVDPYVPLYKIASGSLNDIPLIRYIVKKTKPIIMSTGMATVEEINRAVRLIPKQRLVLLHCISSYPTKDFEVNLNSIIYLRKRFDVPVGYSDHTIGILAPLSAVALGAVAIEKHFTLDKKDKCGDHVLSLEPDEFKDMVNEIRKVEVMRGAMSKRLSHSEKVFRRKMRKGLYAKRYFKKGMRIKEEDIVALRPDKGVSVDQIDSVIGRILKKDVRRLMPIRHTLFKK